MKRIFWWLNFQDVDCLKCHDKIYVAVMNYLDIYNFLERDLLNYGIWEQLYAKKQRYFKRRK